MPATHLNKGLDSETYWGNPETTPALIDFIVETGFKAIRIPTTWHNHLHEWKKRFEVQIPSNNGKFWIVFIV